MFAQHEVDAPDGPAALDTLKPLIARLAAPLDRLEAIGVAAPDPVWRDVPLAATLSSALDVPVVLEDDGQAATWGEFRFGAHRVRSLLAVFVGQSIGAGVVLDGGLWRGGDALGHTRMVGDGVACPCGGRGCLERARLGDWARVLGAAALGAPSVAAA